MLLLGVLGPLCYVLAGVIDRMVEAVLAWHSRRDQPARPGRRGEPAAEPVATGRLDPHGRR